MRTAAEQLLVIDVVWSRGIAVVQTVWLMSGDRLGGRRETRTESWSSDAAPLRAVALDVWRARNAGARLAAIMLSRSRRISSRSLGTAAERRRLPSP